MKKLIFEGAGWSETKRNDVDNCRIRTRIKNKDGRLIYLELGGVETHKWSPSSHAPFKVAGHIDHLFYSDRLEDRKKNYSPELSNLTVGAFEYNKANILKFVNEKLNCDFEEMIVDNDNVHVHDTNKALCAC